MRFDPNTVKRWFSDAAGKPVVAACDYDALHELLKEERQARKDDAREHAREIRDAVAETRWHERESAE